MSVVKEFVDSFQQFLQNVMNRIAADSTNETPSTDMIMDLLEDAEKRWEKWFK